MSSAVWRFLPQSEMRAIFVVVANIVCEKSLEVALVDGDDMVELSQWPMLNPELFLDPGWAACIIATISLRKTTSELFD